MVPEEQSELENNDQLFDADGDWWHLACLKFLPDDWELYVIGYRKAADALIQHVDRRRADQDVLVFPIVYLYRQYLELRLKQIIRRGKALYNELEDFPKTHDLVNLWSDAREVVKRIEPNSSTRDLTQTEWTIQEFSSLDPSSQAFRYPIERSGASSLPLDLNYINLRHLSETLDGVADFLDAVAMEIAVRIDMQQEIERAMEERHYDKYSGSF